MLEAPSIIWQIHNFTLRWTQGALASIAGNSIFHKESILKTVKTLFIFASVVLIGIALGGCDEAQQMVPPSVEDTTTPPVEPATPVEPPEDSGGDTTMPTVEPPPMDNNGGEDTTMPPATDTGGGEDTTMPTVKPPPVVPEGPVVSIMPASVTSPAVGEQLVVEIQVAAAENVFGYELALMFDTTALRYVESANGDYLPGAFFAPSLKNDNQIAISAGAGTASPAESGTLVSVTFEVIARKASALTLADVTLEHGGPTSEPQAVNAAISE